jgi:imidazolonepropionase-like amidohydrolase
MTWTLGPAPATRRGFIKAAGACAAAGLTGALGIDPLLAQGLVPAPAAGDVLFEDVRIFDGKSGALLGPANVLVRGNLIDAISPSPIDAPGAVRIAGQGRILMPGLIDMHWHAMLVRPHPVEAVSGDVGYLNLLAAEEAAHTLLRGFTTIRDLGGPSFGLKRAIEEDLVAGPRIYPSGAVITVTSGHGDFRQLADLPRRVGTLSRMEELGGAMVADSPDEVRMRVREQLMRGASQIKLTAGGGVASPFSPLDVTTFTLPELQAAVEAAENWGTYVCTHAYTPASIQRSIAAGVKCIEHGHLLDEATAQLMAETGTWLSTQPFLDLGGAAALGPSERAKMERVVEGTNTVYTLAKKYELKTAFGTDILFSAALATQQGSLLADLANWYTPAEALVMATSTNAALLALSGERNPYPGRLGVVEAGALADLLLVEGNPLDDLSLVADPANAFKIIMKDGRIYKNTLAG